MTFQYDGLGRMRISTNWDGSTTEYVYDGMRVIQERDGSNTPQVSYTRSLDLSGTMEGAGGIGGLLARSAGYASGNWTSNSYYHEKGSELTNVTFSGFISFSSEFQGRVAHSSQAQRDHPLGRVVIIYTFTFN